MSRKLGKSPSLKPLAAISRRQIIAFLEEETQDTSKKNITVVVYKFNGLFDTDAPRLENAWQAVVDRHDALRTTFVEKDGELSSVLHPPGTVGVQVEHIKLQDPLCDAEIGRKALELVGPHVTCKAPLAGLVVIETPQQDQHFLLFYYHACIIDQESAGLCLKDISCIYRGETLPAIICSYAEFAARPADQLVGTAGKAANQLDFWKSTLNGVSHILELPKDYPRPLTTSSASKTLSFTIPENIVAGLKGNFSSAEKEFQGSSLMYALLTAYYITLVRYSKQREVIVALTKSLRPLEMKDVVGQFENILPVLLGSPVAEEHHEKSFATLAMNIEESVKAAMQHGHVSFASIVAACCSETSGGAGPQLAQAAFRMESTGIIQPLHFDQYLALHCTYALN